MLETLRQFTEMFTVPVIWMAENPAEARARRLAEENRRRAEAEEAARLVSGG